MVKGRKQNTVKRKETSLELVGSNFDEAIKVGKRVVEEKVSPKTQVKKIRLTGYVEPEIYKRIVNGMLEERMKKREEGQEGSAAIASRGTFRGTSWGSLCHVL